MGTISFNWIGQRCCNEGTAVGIEVTRMTAKVFERHGFCSIDTVAHLDGIEIDFHNAMLRPEGLDEDGEIDFEGFACPRRSWPKKYVFGCLLADGTGPSYYPPLLSV